MRKTANAANIFDQKELVDFIKSVKQFKHLAEDDIVEYCNHHGRQAEWDMKIQFFYNPYDAINTLFWDHGMSCPICSKHYRSKVFCDEKIPYELKICFLPDIPYISTNRNIYAPVMCQDCMEQYEQYKKRDYIKKKIETFDDKFRLPIMFLNFMSKRLTANKSKSVNSEMNCRKR